MINEPIIPRESVMLFAEDMELKLRRNDHKDNWRHETAQDLLAMLKVEVAELETAITLGCDPIEIICEAADVANFAMFLADKYARRTALTGRES